ncbi:MAG: Gfo/Idh/MocA family oxidoreductase [Clostridium sp.]|nr:Gfo/Idh/MocA family oxidoreductase [Clostridium sp.]
MKIGIMGAGAIAMKMAKTLNLMEEAQCYAVASRSLEKAEKFAADNGVLKAYGSYEDMLKDQQVELVYIATPHSHHYDCAKLCLAYRKPVLCEKAFMANAAQTREILDAFEKADLFITEAIWTRYLPSRRMIDEVVASGELGEITFVTANLGADVQWKDRLQKPELAGGALLDVGIYPLNFISMVLGTEVEEITSSCTKTASGVDEQNAVILKFKNGAMAIAHSGMLSVTEQYGIVYGTKGYLIAEGVNNVQKLKVYDKARQLKWERDVPEQLTGFEDEVRASIKAIEEGKKECEEMPHKETLRMMEMMDGLRRDWGVKFPFEEQ